MMLSRRQMFERGHHIPAMSILGAITAVSCTPVLLRSQGNRAGLVAISARADSAFSGCAQATNPIDTVTPASEPFGVVDPRDQNHVVISWMQRARFGVTVLRSAASFDGGESWPYVTTLPLTSCATRTSYAFHTAGDPWLASGENGLIYASGLSFTEDSASGIAVTTSRDGGRSWGAPVIAMAVSAKQGQYDNSSLAVRTAASRFRTSPISRGNPDRDNRECSWATTTRCWLSAKRCVRCSRGRSARRRRLCSRVGLTTRSDLHGAAPACIGATNYQDIGLFSTGIAPPPSRRGRRAARS